MNVEVITIGDELLIGQVVDTNSAWMGRELNGYGFEITRITSVRDRMDEMIGAFGEALGRADVVLVTGGLGPTKDDRTKQALCRYFGGKLVFDEWVLRNIEEVLGGRAFVMNDSTRAQAFVPDCCTVIGNGLGTAPAMWFERSGRVLVSMPGVPCEMEHVMVQEVMPRLVARFADGSVILHRTCLVRDFTESSLSEFLEPFEAELPDGAGLAYLPAPGVIRLRLTVRGSDRGVSAGVLDGLAARLRGLLGDRLFSEEERPLGELVGRLLLARGWTLSTAESCTGGAIAAAITSVPGSSVYFKGSVVAYANEVKERVLGVDRQILLDRGAVSAETVEGMCAGAMRLFETDCSVAVSGIAGPDGGTLEKPVGTVWIGVRCGDRTECRLFGLGQRRETNTARAVREAMLMLVERLTNMGKGADGDKNNFFNE